MGVPDIPAAKRAGLPVDLARLTAEGDDWLSPEERYALKTHGVCAQAQPGVFMIRCRTGGRITTESARRLADLAERFGMGWIHVTTRQQIELHHVAARDVERLLEGVRRAGLTTRSTCGHTMRGVMSCPDAGVGLDEPFDCYPDALAVAKSILALTPELDTRMPSRINVMFGGCLECRQHALLNDIGFVSVVADDGILGYELWLGGSLGKSVPTLAIRAREFLSREDVLPAAHAVFDLFTTYGDFEHPNKARLKFLIHALGAERFLHLFERALEDMRARPWPEPVRVSSPLSSSLVEVLSHVPEGGWSKGVRPQRQPGFAMVTVNVPLGDLMSQDVRRLCDISDDLADGHLYLTRNQNVMFRFVSLDAVPALRVALAGLGLSVDGADTSRDVRTCTGGPVCSLALTPAPAAGAALVDHPALARNSGLRVHVSGCPNACAQHQIADIGLSGGKVTIAGVPVLGYQVWLGGDLEKGVIGRVVGRVAEGDVPAIVEAIVGTWEALRDRTESLSDTVARVGLASFRAHIAAVFRGRWEPGPEPGAEPGPVLDVRGLEPDRKLPLVWGSR